MQLFEYIDILNQPYDIFYTDSGNAPLHWHYYCEILFMVKGKIRIICNNREAILSQGDLCYIYPLQLHEIAPVSEEEVYYAVIKFDIHTINIPKAFISDLYDIFVRRTVEEDFCLILEEQGSNEFAELVKCIETEFAGKKQFFSMQIQAGLHSLLILCARRLEKHNRVKAENHTETDFSFFRILEYIDTHSSEPLEIRELANMCCMSYSHFAKLFRENYGRSCKEYITYIRLNKAQDLLLNTDYDLNHIALESGFFDCSHFIRTYKKWRGITPKQERLALDLRKV